MSKPASESPAVAPETTATSQSTAISTSQKSVWDLLKLDVSSFIEKKQGLSYVSWAHAWAIALKADPAANFNVRMFDGRCAMYVNETAMVWVDVTLFGKTVTAWLPVMDHRNKPIQDPDAFQINTALMRCMTKALGFHGIGLNVYAGEDLPLELPGDEKNEETAGKKEEKPSVVKEQKKPEVKEEEKKEEKKDTDPRLSAELFTESFVEYMIVVKDNEGLNSYWKSNQSRLDKLKTGYPDLYERCLSVAKDRRQQLSKE